MRLSDLIRGRADLRRVGEGDPEILSLTSDSRAVKAGALFAALPGTKRNGQDYVPAAMSAGAAAVLLNEALSDCDLPQLVAEEPRRVLAELASVFYGHPTNDLRLVGVTGTNGKTTVAHGVRHILKGAGKPTGMLGTIEYDTLDSKRPAPLTTPDCIEFSAALARIRDAGGECAVAEVSSHALEQDRVAGHEFACGVFTNLTRDHLDYHGDMETYLEAKRRLFRNLNKDATAVVNVDDPAGSRMLQDCPARRIGYGLGVDASLRAEIIRADLSGSELHIHWQGQVHMVETPLVGVYNGMNALAMAGAVLSLGLRFEEIADGLRSFRGAPGRLEVMNEAGVTVVVDYAHTDDAMRAVLETLRPLTPRTLWVVFGCGGDRDRGKRPLMAQVAERCADRVVVTSDNPRTEDPEAILHDVVRGFSHPEAVMREADRPQAIDHAIRHAGVGDVVLIAGKGHEDYQILGTERVSMDDRALARSALRRHHGSPSGASGAA